MALLSLSGPYFVHTYVSAPAAQRGESTRLRLARLDGGEGAAGEGGAEGRVRLEERIALYEEHIARLERLIPTKEEVAALLEAVSNEERRAGVEMTMMRPEPVEPGDHYDRLSYQVAVTGGYHAVGAFLTAVASLERILAPADLAITSGDASAPQPGARDGAASASFRLRTYLASPPQSPTAQSQAGNGAPTS